MKCFVVKCIDKNGVEHSVGVMTYDEKMAVCSAIKALKEGKHVDAFASDVFECDAI